jgi:hypothetical protein
MALDRQTAVDRFATFRERESALEALVRELPPGTPREKLLGELEALREPPWPDSEALTRLQQIEKRPSSHRRLARHVLGAFRQWIVA